jgi:hypothetical protein
VAVIPSQAMQAANEGVSGISTELRTGWPVVQKPTTPFRTQDELLKSVPCSLVVDCLGSLKYQDQMGLGEIRFVHRAIKNLFNDSTRFASFLLFAREPGFDLFLRRKVSLLAPLVPVFFDASAEAVTGAPFRVLFDGTQAESIEMRLEFGIMYEDFGSRSAR